MNCQHSLITLSCLSWYVFTCKFSGMSEVSVTGCWDLLGAFAGCINATWTWTSKGDSAAVWTPTCVWLCVYIYPETPFFVGQQTCGCVCFAPHLSRKHLDRCYRHCPVPPPAFICGDRCVLGEDCLPAILGRGERVGWFEESWEVCTFLRHSCKPAVFCWYFCIRIACSEAADFISTGFGPHMFHAMGPPPPFMRAPGPIHYPSQDPQRMGAHAGKHSSP